jgi:hypothetical protein
MCFFYLIYNLTSKGKSEKDGPKNARTFIIGAILYIVVFMVIMNLSLRYKFQSGILKSSLILLLVADIATMGYLYKSYYGRSILNEADIDNDKDWKFNEKSHKYDRKTTGDKKVEAEMDKLNSDYNRLEMKKLRKKIDEKQEDGDEPAQLTNHSTTNGTRYPNRALVQEQSSNRMGTAFNTEGLPNV